MSHSKAAIIYTKALFELTSTSTQLSSETLYTLEQLNTCFSDSVISQFFNNPASSSESKKASISTVFAGKISKEIEQFLVLLVDKNRTNLIGQIAHQYKKMSDEKLGLAQGQVYSAHSMSDEFKANLVAAFEKISNKKVTLTYEVRPSMVGGISAQIGGLSYTDSTENHLNRLKEDLNRGVN